MASQSRFRLEGGRIARIACWLIPFALIVYLGMRRGGYEEQIRGPIGALLWVLIAGGLLSWALPRARISKLAWVGLGLLVAYGTWTTIGISWSESAGRSVTEATRVGAYIGIFTAAILLGGRERLRTIAGAVAAACFVIAAVALLSRLHPAWFPADTISDRVVGIEGRLRYPVGYWNALAGLVAIGVPLMVWAATSARSLLLRGLAAAAMPTMALATYFTYSRAGAITAIAGVVVYLALSRRRLALLLPIATMTGISALVVWQGSRRDALANGVDDATAHVQGNEMIGTVLVGSAIVGLIVWGLAMAERQGMLPKAPEVPRRIALIALGTTALIALVGFVGAGGVGHASDRFESFKEPATLGTDSGRLTSASGNGRWEYWGSAVDAFESEPVKGIGPGTFQFWWNQNRDTDGVIRDAHSLFVETLGELGIIGLLLIASFFALVLVVGTQRALRAAGERRGELAALTGAALTFTLGAAVDWLWELAVVPAAFLLIAAAILATRDDDEDREAEFDEDAATAVVVDSEGEGGVEAPRGRFNAIGEPALRAGGALASLAIAIAIFIPASAAQDLADSRNAFDSGDLSTALSAAESAADKLPFAADPRIQQGYVYEDNEELARAATAARAATEREPTNWETFYLLSRIQAQRDGKRGAALTALRRAQELNPRNTLVTPINCDLPGNPCATTPAP